ncbi:MAG: glutaredoxin family protein [Candidatus Helarchaeota archaeon]
MKDFTKIPGKYDKNEVKIYTISTCMWCRRLKRKLSENNIAYSYLDIDLLTGEEKSELRPYLRQFRSVLAFPMMFINEEFIPNQFIDEKIRRLVSDA